MQKLNLYHVDDDLNGTNTDNILLTLRNKNKDVATIRVYDERVENNSNTFDANAQYYIKNEDDTYSRITFRSEDEFNTYVGTTGAAQLYINNYKVRYLIVRSSSGINEAAIDFDISEWIDEQLITGEDNLLEDLTNFTIKSIGTLGAYLCLAKNEIQDVLEADVLTHKPTEYLKSFGVNLLREKQNTYLTLFQAQIEEMYAQDKYQCIVSASQPSGKYPENTRWFDLSTTILKVWTNNVWVIDNISVSPSDIENYENYQRYIDNYYKLQAVQQVLNEKEKEATYWLSGYAVENREIDIRNYVEDTDGVLRYNGQSLEGDMQRAAQSHFKNNIITRVSMDVNFPLYKFMASEYPDKIFAVYLKNRIPYVAYADAEDVWQMEMDYYNQATELQNFFTDNQYLRLCPFIKEDEYINDNYLLTSYESEEERLDIYNELLEEANKELKKMAQPTLEFNMSMANILALPDFYPILNQFKLGNFIRIELYDNIIKRVRLLSISIDFNDIANLTCSFGNLVSVKSEIDRHADLMKQAISAGKQVAMAAGTWSKGATKVDQIENEINNGLQNINIEVGKASGKILCGMTKVFYAAN